MSAPPQRRFAFDVRPGRQDIAGPPAALQRFQSVGRSKQKKKALKIKALEDCWWR